MTASNPRYVDAQNFSQNAAELLLDRDQLVEFLGTLDYYVTDNRAGDGYLGLCPVCEQSNCMIGVRGSRHRIWWRCLSRACEAGRDDFRTPRNLLSLVKFLVGSQGAAFKTISKFLGYEGRSFDITNGKLGVTGGVPKGEASPAKPDYIFLVRDESQKEEFDQAGIESVVYREGRIPDRGLIFSLFGSERVRVPMGAIRLSPYDWYFLSTDELREKALSLIEKSRSCSPS